MPRGDVLAIVWSPHEARTAAYADWLDAELHNVHFLREKRPWLAPIKYVMQWAATWWLLARKRPRVVYVTNSPPVAGLCVLGYSALTPTRFVLDTHPPGLYNRRWAWSRPIQRFTARRASMNVIDQERFAELFRSWGVPVLVLENPPKRSLPQRGVEPDPERPTVTYVGTFGADEPIDELLAAARSLPEVRFNVLGDTALARRSWIDQAPTNVAFTGYLLREQYWERIYEAHAVIVLTTHRYSLLGGAQDGLFADTPLILSDQPTLREYFTAGAIFTPNTGEGIAEAVRTSVAEQSRLREEIRALRQQTASRWQQAFTALRTHVDELAGR